MVKWVGCRWWGTVQSAWWPIGLVLVVLAALESCKPPVPLSFECNKDQPCLNGGTCVGRVCQCPPGYYGYLCESTQPGPCNPQMPCLNGGECRDGRCFCPNGYLGLLCEQVDSCQFITCENNGNCLNNRCSCPFGYTGTRCEKLVYQDLLGTYTGTQTCEGQTQSAVVVISSENPTFGWIQVSGLNGYSARATASGTSFSIGGNEPFLFTYSGAGALDGKKLIINFTVLDRTPRPPAQPITTRCSFVLEKQ